MSLENNTFYTIVTIAIIVVCFMWVIVLYYLFKIFKYFKNIANSAENEFKKIVKDIEIYRQDIKQGEKEIKLLAKTAKKIIK